MKIKTCKKCGAEKPLFDFYKQSSMADGHFNKCKECTKMGVRENRADNIEYYREYDRIRGSRQSLEDQRIYRSKNKHKQQEYREHRRKQVNAQAMVSQYVKKGKLEKLPCEICGNIKSVGHHEDYNQPLVVIWLCDKHHKWIHCNPKNGGKTEQQKRKGYKRSDSWYKSLGFNKKQ